MIERCLIEHCSPTLAAMKPASLFTLAYTSDEELQNYIDIWNACFENKGISMVVLRKHHHVALLYVFREALLIRDLNKMDVRNFLSNYGYYDMNIQQVIQHLQTRICDAMSFPHEIGVFLGYPLHDVIGFIENGGHNCKCCGYWKVYDNEIESIQLFAKFKKCHDIYKRLWTQGKSVLQLTVAV